VATPSSKNKLLLLCELKKSRKKFHIQKTMSPFDDFSTRKRKKSTLDTTLKNRKKIHCVT
jgi:hypothetical protein